MTNADIVQDLGLSPNTSQHTYRNINHFTDILSHETDLFTADEHATTTRRSQYIIFHNVTESCFNRDFIDPADSFVSFESYFPLRAVLLVKIVTRGQALAVSDFGGRISFQLRRMSRRLDDRILALGSAHVISQNRIKRAGASFFPKRLPANRSRTWPSLCVEVGYSDSPRKLEEDAKWWIHESRGEVKGVVTVELDKSQREMRVSQWRICGDSELKLVYRVVILQRDGRMEAHEENDLVISFEDLSLRPPNRDRGGGRCCD